MLPLSDDLNPTSCFNLVVFMMFENNAHSVRRNYVQGRPHAPQSVVGFSLPRGLKDQTRPSFKQMPNFDILDLVMVINSVRNNERVSHLRISAAHAHRRAHRRLNAWWVFFDL